ncbi:VOC family protein [Thiobacillus sp.]|uniref:VOC family protein n=1 Tax=Thiobacillus sp. TaxID=924 RepID=UPI0025F27D6A|nr:VOC family protein [Thiobacillus sp.]MBT9540906.1 VOC family protein [Thiobacillus sp.]
MTAPVKPIPEGMHSLTPHLVCRDANAAMDFYISAFGARDGGRLPGPDGKLMHGMMWIGDSALMLVDENPQWGMHSPLGLNGTPVIVHLYVEDVDATMARAVEAGATLTMPATDMFWGDRYGQVRDPFGHQWSIATHIRDMSPEEIQAASKTGCVGA